MTATGFEPQLFDIDLTSAGSRTFDLMGGHFRFINAEDATGALKLSAKVTVRIGQTAGREVTLRLNNAIKGKSTRHITVTWAAQSGITATFLLSPDAEEIDVDADPPTQLVQADVGGTITDGTKQTVADAADYTIAANADRRELHLYCDKDVTIGASPDASTGMFVKAETPVVLATTAAVTVSNDSGASASLYFFELEA